MSTAFQLPEVLEFAKLLAPISAEKPTGIDLRTDTEDAAAAGRWVEETGAADHDRARLKATGKLIAVWGPTGAPGRSVVAAGLAAHLADLGLHTVLIDGDVYGGSVAAPAFGEIAAFSLPYLGVPQE